MICENCLYKLELFNDFRDRSLRTESLLVNLLKEISNTKLANSVGIIKLSPNTVIDHNNMIMIHHHSLLAEHGIQNIADLDLSQLDQQHVQQEIILSQPNVDLVPHSLTALELNHHDLTSQDLSNHSLPSQDGILVHDCTCVQYTHSNLQLMQQEQQLLTEQYRMQHDLQETIQPSHFDLKSSVMVQDDINAINDNGANVKSDESEVCKCFCVLMVFMNFISMTDCN